MKYFYACPEIPVDHDEVIRERFRYWDCEQHIYKEERLVCLDTRKPGDKTVPLEKLEVVRDRFQEWTLFPGQLKVNSPSMVEDESLAATRKVRLQEDKALKESISRQKHIEQLIFEETKKCKRDSNNPTAAKKVKKATTPALVVVNSSQKGLRATNSNASATNATNTLITTKQLNYLLAEITELKRLNQSQSGSQSQQSATVLKLHNDIAEEDSKIMLAQKKRKLAEEDLETAQTLQATKRLELEAMEFANQLRREGELQRIKLKVQADEIQDESSRRRAALADEERRRRYNHEDQQRRQEMHFATEEHALMIHKEKANLQMAASNQQHEQQLQLIYASQQPNNLAMIMGNISRPTHGTPTAAFEGADSSKFLHTSVTSCKVVQKEEAEEVNDIVPNNDLILQKLLEELQREKDIQNRLKERDRAGVDDGDVADNEDA